MHEPIGVIALITPWNFPLLIVSQKLPFALAAGCTCVVKPSEFTSGTTLRLAGLLLEAGLPAGVCNVLTGYGEPVGRLLSEHPDVDMISFTGSTAVGKRIVAASQGNLKKVTLELGGKNPQIVFPDADLEAALDAVVFGVYFNAGECCNSGSRLLLHRDVPPSFVERIVERARSLPVGDPLNERTKVGAIINAAQFAKITDYITAAKKAGARLLLGGDARASGGGHFVDPTVFAEVRPEMSIAREEIFGPVLSILRFDTVEEATAPRQRYDVRAVGRGLDPRPGPGAGPGSRDPGGHGLGEHLHGRPGGNAVRRLSAKWPGSGTRTAGGGRLHPDQSHSDSPRRAHLLVAPGVRHPWDSPGTGTSDSRFKTHPSCRWRERLAVLRRP
ncbi:MAG: aldehyde dehydrogenase family protein [Lacunisphaera sp.]